MSKTVDDHQVQTADQAAGTNQYVNGNQAVGGAQAVGVNQGGKGGSAKKRVLLILGAMILVAATVFICYFLFVREKDPLKYADNASTGIMPGVDIDQRRKELQDLLDKSKIAFSINTTPVFESGATEGNLLIENPGNNAKLIKVSIQLSETEEEVFSTDYMKPGTYIESAKLSKVLEKGSYPATAYFLAYDEETAEFIGQTGAEITLTVQN